MDEACRVDHVVILVDDLAAAVEGYRKLGFTVVPGGRHEAWGTHNALIGLADGSYLELIAFDDRPADPAQRGRKEARFDALRTDGRSPVECRVMGWGSPAEGLVDFALLPPAIEKDLARAVEHGLVIDGPLPGARKRTDGQDVRWQLGIPSTYDVPFLCGDVTDRSLRVPAGKAAEHANGVSGIDRITVAVGDLDASAMRYRALLGDLPVEVDFRWPETRAVAFRIGTVTVALVAPVGVSSPVRDVLARRGEGPMGLDLRCTRQDLVGPLALVPAHGAEIGLVRAVV